MPQLRSTIRPLAIALTIAAALLAANVHPVTSQKLNAAGSSDVVSRIIGGTTATSSQFQNVGALQNRGFTFCSGTLIAPNWVLTAGHCVEGIRSSRLRRYAFTVGGNSYAWSSIKIHPTYNFPDGDVALVKLTTSVSGITPASLRTVAPQVGETMTIVGFGLNGTGANGTTNGTSGIKRYGSVVLDGIEPKFVTWNFDSPELNNTAPGDSGGPGFIGGLIASTTSGGSNANAGYGDESFNTRTDVYVSWINTTLGRANSLDRVPSGIRALVSPVTAVEMAVELLPDTPFIESTIRPLVLDRDVPTKPTTKSHR